MLYFPSEIQSLSTLWQPLTLILLFLSIILVVAEGLNRLTSVKGEITRKVVHIGTGNVILLAWWFHIPTWIGIGASVMAAIMSLISYFVPILPSVNSVGRTSLGTFFYAISIGILIAWFWPCEQFQYAAIGILIMTWGDGMAAIVGQSFGKHPYTIMGSQKSWEGSLTMFLMSFLVTSVLLLTVMDNSWLTWLFAFCVALTATILETFSKLGIDNLTVPVGSAALAFFLSNT